MPRRRSSEAEQGTHKPLAGGSIPPVGTTILSVPAAPRPTGRDPTVQPEPASVTPVSRRGFVGLEQRVLARLRELGLDPGATVVVGFSGGADSLALAAVLGRLAGQGGPRLLLAHVDHALRSSSAAEAANAADLAAALGLPFRAVRLSDDPQKLHPGVGLEEAARRERYLAFAEAVAASEAVGVTLAHHQDDQAETVLLHLLRGAGVAGAAGMAEWSSMVVPWWGDQAAPGRRLAVWRPFLDEPKTIVREYAGRLGLAPVEDPSNADRDLRRNALRHEALPILNRIVPSATAALARFARLAAADDAYLEEIVAVVYRRAVTETGDLSRRRWRANRRRCGGGWCGAGCGSGRRPARCRPSGRRRCWG